MRDGLQIENQFALLAFAKANLLFGKILKTSLRYSDNVILEVEIRNAQLAISGELRLKFSVEKDLCLVLSGDYNERAEILAGFQECIQCRRCASFNVKLVLIAAARNH